MLIEPETSRLHLRQWKMSDLPQFARMNADPEVMKYYPAELSSEESDAIAHQFAALIAERGWGFWAIERREDNKFIGFTGLHMPTYELPVTSCVEIGWRLGREYWGCGYATEAARAALRTGFERLDLSEIYSFTSVLNRRSCAVMQRLGMSDSGKNFIHPLIEPGHRLAEHVLYRISRYRWAKD